MSLYFILFRLSNIISSNGKVFFSSVPFITVASEAVWKERLTGMDLFEMIVFLTTLALVSV